MIEKLHKIVVDVANAPDLVAALDVAVRGVREATLSDACALYLVDRRDNSLVLREADGLARSSIDTLRLPHGEGVVGLVRSRGEPVRLDNASEHPSFVPVPESGETRYRAFLGVPLIHFRRVIGVLAVFRRGRRRFAVRHEAFLVTASAQLAGIIATSLVKSEIRHERSDAPEGACLQGVAGAPGVGIGILVGSAPQADLESVLDVAGSDPVFEEAAFREAVVRVQTELEDHGERMKAFLPSETYALFEVYAMLAGDDGILSNVIDRIKAGQAAPAALRDAIREIVAAFDQMTDERLRARGEDVRAIGRQLLLALQADSGPAREYPERTVLIGDEVSLARIASVPRERLMGVVCLGGSLLSHTTVIARSLGIPAVMGVGYVPAEGLDGSQAVVDGYRGRVFINPAAVIVDEFSRFEREESEITSELQSLKDSPAETPDGVTMPLLVNTGLLTDLDNALDVNPGGVGLYRSEFPFMLRETFPSEHEQARTYRSVLEAFAPRPVIMRTLDIGGDKPLPYFPIEEPNALLGWRGIRISLQHPELFRAQLKAMLRADVGLGNLRVMLPMVSMPQEVVDARRMLDEAVRDLRAEGVEVNSPPLGVMIEVPSTLFHLEELAPLVEFFSLGTNDLTQYMVAVDRGNPRVSLLYDHLNPAVLRAMRQFVRGAQALGKPVSVCGELAGDPAGAVLLLGLGVDSLSVASPLLPRVKWVIRTVSRARAAELLEQALRLSAGSDVRRLLHRELDQAGLGGLLRAGR